MPGTKFDMEAIDAYTILIKMQSTQLAKLEVDLDGDTVADHWAGYIYFALSRPTQKSRNQMIGQVIILNLQNGQSAGANAWMKEVNKDARGSAMVNAANIELWSADALAVAESRVVNDGDQYADAFGLYPRFHIVDANTGQTCVFIWKSRNWNPPPGFPGYIDLHVFIYNDKEQKVSGNIPLPNELNIICLDPGYLPTAYLPGYPKQGFIALEMDDISNRGFFGDLEWAGYSWIYAAGPLRESWSYLTDIHRDVKWGDSEWDNSASTRTSNCDSWDYWNQCSGN
jgi:hypothetical protein